MAVSLKYHFDAVSSYVLGKPVVIKITFENLAATDIWILKWYTPLEGIKGKILAVTCDGAEIPYEGRLMKRGNPQREDYVMLHPGALAQAEFDLSETYSLRVCSECVVSFKGRIHDVVIDPKQLPRVADEHTPVDASGDSISFRIEK
jgi:hypothetical protein